MTMRARITREAGEAKKAREAVASVKDPELREVAYEKVLASIRKDRKLKKVKTLADVEKLKSEAQIQAECCTVLDAMKTVWFLTDASRSFGPDGTPRKSKVTPGCPDLVAIAPPGFYGPAGGYFIGIEIKRPGKKQSLEQLKTQARIEYVEGTYWLIHSAEELKNKLEGKS